MLWQYLKTDVIGSKRNVYGLTGDRVMVISNHHPALVVQNEKGDKFSTTYDNLCASPIQKQKTDESTTASKGNGNPNPKRNSRAKR